MGDPEVSLVNNNEILNTCEWLMVMRQKGKVNVQKMPLKRHNADFEVSSFSASEARGTKTSHGGVNYLERINRLKSFASNRMPKEDLVNMLMMCVSTLRGLMAQTNSRLSNIYVSKLVASLIANAKSETESEINMNTLQKVMDGVDNSFDVLMNFLKSIVNVCVLLDTLYKSIAFSGMVNGHACDIAKELKEMCVRLVSLTVDLFP